MKRIDIKHIPKRLTVKGAQLFIPATDNNGVATSEGFYRVSYYPPKPYNMVAYCTGKGGLHYYPEKMLLPSGKTSLPVTLSGVEDTEVKDFMLCKDKDHMLIVSADGYGRMISGAEAPQKKRGTKPYNLYGKFKHGEISAITRLKNRDTEVWVFLSEGYCAKLEKEALIQAASGIKVNFIDTLKFKDPGMIVSAVSFTD